MQTFARIIALLGVIIVVVAAVLLVGNIYRINILYASALPLRGSSLNNPVYNIMLGTGLALVGGFVAGFGVALMTRRPEATLRRPS